MKILVIRLSSLGDVILTTALLRCLHEQVAGAEIHFLTKTAYANLVVDNPHVARVHVVDSKPYELLGQLRREHFDYVADLQGNATSRRFRRLLHVKGASYDKQDLGRLLTVLLKGDRTDHRHVAERYFDAVRSLGVHPDGKGLECHYQSSDLTTLLVDSHRHPLPAQFLDRPYAVIAVGSQHVTKCIPLDKLQLICTYIQGPVVLVGDGADRRRIKDYGVRLHSNVANLCGKTTLSQSMQLIDHAAVVLTGDSGMMHVAAALGVPIVAVWGSTTPAFGFAPYQSDAANMEVDLWCRPCHRFGRSRCPLKHFECMERQPWQRIGQALNAALEGGAEVEK